jgi:subtilase family serine protease
MRNRCRRGVHVRLEQLDDRCLLSGLTPAQVTTAYGLNAVTFHTPTGTIKGDGSGETVALVEAFHDPFLQSDLATFDAEYNLPPPRLTVVNLAGHATNPSWQLEESLDVEWVHAIAPGAAILVVESQSQSFASTMRAVQIARKTPGVVAVSMSWSFNEFPTEASYNSIFTTPAGHTGITFLASSGDSGPQLGAVWPAAIPSVVAVGGTTLNVDASGHYQSEVAWLNFFGGTSGGYSRYEAEPRFQRSVQSIGKRSTPDVAFDADPDTGVSVYATSLWTGQGSWSPIGGTSLGAPAWAAMLAIVDQGRALEGKGTLDGATQTLPALYSLPSADFNVIAPLPGQRANGANTSTGLGTPNGAVLVHSLVETTISVPLTTSRNRPAPSARSALKRKRSRLERGLLDEIRKRFPTPRPARVDRGADAPVGL